MSSESLLDGLHSRAIPGFFFEPGDARILGWVQEAIAEGERYQREDPMWSKIDQGMDYVIGQQLAGPRPTYLPNVVINQSRKAVRTHVSALTDIRPLFAFKTRNTAFEEQSVLLNNLTLIWWVNTFADLALGDAIRYASVAGSGDLVAEWDPHFMEGDVRLLPRDPRDTIPIRPTRERSIQTWEGLILREAHSVNKLRGMYPDMQALLTPDVSGKFGGVYTKFRRVLSMVGPVSTLDGLKKQERKSGVVPEIVLWRTYLTDRSVNKQGKTILMGKPGTNWCYRVEPGEPLYPQKRLILATERAILYDGPSQYWHGMYPVSRLQLDSWPWLHLGLPLLSDLYPLQDAINNTTNDILTAIAQVVNRGAIFDQNAVPEPVFKRFDPRKPNWKLKLKATMGEGFKMADPPQIQPWMLEFLKGLFAKFDEIAETANLQQLMQLRQLPGADTIEKYYNSLTPGLKIEGRMVETTLREVADMWKANVFQFMSSKRRMLLLGDAGRALSDFDLDPDTLVPALKKGLPGYSPELDASIPRDLRAKYFYKLFSFYVAPNSILAMHAQDQQMKYVQLSREGYMDFWTLMEMLEIPNVGSPPPIPIPKQDGSGMEVRVPVTITERLMAQQQLGLGMAASPAGRKASGQQPPSMATGNQGQPVIRESR